MKEPEREIARLKRLVADLALDKAILQETQTRLGASSDIRSSSARLPRIPASSAVSFTRRSTACSWAFSTSRRTGRKPGSAEL
jgi:hypothetical protein